MVKIVAVSGSRRESSTTRAALQVALDAISAADADAETSVIDLSAVDLPLYHPDRDEQGDSEALKRRVREAHGVVVGSPVYHGSYSSTFKSFHDYCSKDEYESTAVGLLATAGGGSYGGALEHMRGTIRGVHGWVVPHQVGIRNAYRKVEGGELVDEGLVRRTEELGQQVFEHARRLNPDA